LYISNKLLHLLIFVLYLVVEAEPDSRNLSAFNKTRQKQSQLCVLPIRDRIKALNVSLHTICRNLLASCCNILWNQ